MEEAEESDEEELELEVDEKEWERWRRSGLYLLWGGRDE